MCQNPKLKYRTIGGLNQEEYVFITTFLAQKFVSFSAHPYIMQDEQFVVHVKNLPDDEFDSLFKKIDLVELYTFSSSQLRE